LGAVEIARVTGERVEIGEGAGGIAGDFGRDGVVALKVRAVIAATPPEGS